MTIDRTVLTRRVGRFRVHALQAGVQRLDGGAMFGVVPKTLWSQRIPADDRNRILLGMRCLLVEHDDGLVLIDTGLGNKEGDKFKQIYGVENEGASGRTWLEDALHSLGHGAQDIRWVINTHLHFDHAGGNTWRNEGGEVLPVFPNATYVVQRGELEWATHTNERTAASYLEGNWAAVQGAGRLRLLDGDGEILAGISGRLTPGHTPFHQSIVLSGGDETACFVGDLCPTAAHIPLPWIMGYDVEPLRSLESKRALFAQARREQWLMIFEHDAQIPWGRLSEDGKGLQVA